MIPANFNSKKRNRPIKNSNQKTRIFKVEDSTNTSFKVVKCDSSNIILKKYYPKEVSIDI